MNATLERHGRSDLVDHRSFARQGIDREPGRHYGPFAPHVAARGQDHERLNEAAASRDDTDRVQAIDLEMTRLEAAREELLRDGLSEERQLRDTGRDSKADFYLRRALNQDPADGRTARALKALEHLHGRTPRT